MRLPRPRRKRTRLLLLAAFLLLPALLLGALSLRLLFGFRDIATGVRQEYGDYMAELAVRELEGELLDLEQVDMIAARFVPPETPDEVVRFLNRFQGENPLYRLSFFVVPEGLVHYSRLDPEGTADLRPLPAWIVDHVLAALQRQPGVPTGLRHLAGEHGGQPLQVTYFSLESEDGRTLGAAGFVWDLDAVRADESFLRRVLVGGVRGERNLFRGAFFESPLVISLLDENGDRVFTTDPDAGTDYQSLRSLERVLPFYRVGVQIRDDRFSQDIATTVRASAALIAAMFLMILLALAFSLRYVLHEIELAEVKSALVSNVSHELKTPLALIRLYSETLELGRVPTPEKEKEFLRIIGRESQRLTHLINNVLDLNRIEQGRKIYRRVPTDLAPLVNETVEAYRFSLDDKGFVVDSEVESGIPLVPADGEELTQELLNLMDNAVKYSTDEKRIHVSLAREGDMAVIAVTDRGVGIPQAEQDRIFEAFYRVERGLEHDVKGSGLGLALVRHIAAGHGGRVEVRSRPGEGSTFSLRLPLGDVAVPTADEETT